jgi:hypothetical protein
MGERGRRRGRQTMSKSNGHSPLHSAFPFSPRGRCPIGRMGREGIIFLDFILQNTASIIDKILREIPFKC